MVSNNQTKFVSQANAAVAGMDYHALKNDYDFRQAVITVAEEECFSGVNLKAKITSFGVAIIQNINLHR